MTDLRDLRHRWERLDDDTLPANSASESSTKKLRELHSAIMEAGSYVEDKSEREELKKILDEVRTRLEKITGNIAFSHIAPYRGREEPSAQHAGPTTPQSISFDLPLRNRVFVNRDEILRQLEEKLKEEQPKKARLHEEMAKLKDEKRKPLNACERLQLATPPDRSDAAYVCDAYDRVHRALAEQA